MPHQHSTRYATPEHKTSDERMDESSDNIKWMQLSQGECKRVVYTSRTDLSLVEHSPYKGPWAYLQPMYAHCLTEPSRALRVLKEVNPLWAAGLYQQGLVVPFFKTYEITDEEKAQKVLDIYQRTRRIVIDGMCIGNIVDNDKEVACMDTDGAVKRDSPASLMFLSIKSEGVGSLPDKATWANGTLNHALLHADSQPDRLKETVPETIKVITCLFYLEKYLESDDICDEFILFEMMDAIDCCREKQLPLNKTVMEAMLALIKTRGMSPDDIIAVCFLGIETTKTNLI